MFFDWRRKEREGLIFLSSVVISLVLTACLSVLLIFVEELSGWCWLVSGLLFLITISIPFLKNLKVNVAWSLILAFFIEVITGFTMNVLEVWLGMIAFDLGVLYLLIRNKVI